MRTGEESTLSLLDAPHPTSDAPQEHSALLTVLDSAMAQPLLRRRLAADVVSTLHGAGVRISAADLKAMLGISGATDLELVQLLQVRLSGMQSASCGCGGSDD